MFDSQPPSSSSSDSSKRRAWLLRAVLLVLALGGVALYGLIHFEYPGRDAVYNALGLNPTVKWVGKMAPTFRLRDLRTNKLISLSSFRGKVVLLDFWASWCHSCRRQLPIIQRLHRDPALKSWLQILTINMKETAPPAAVRRFLVRSGYDFPVLQGTPALVKQYGIWFFPALVVVTPQGKVFATAAELHDETKIRALLAQARHMR